MQIFNIFNIMKDFHEWVYCGVLLNACSLSYFPVVSFVLKDKSQTLFVPFRMAVVVESKAVCWASIAGKNFFLLI